MKQYDIERQLFRGVLIRSFSEQFLKICSKTPATKLFFSKAAGRPETLLNRGMYGFL